jgi:hypothetical protein
MKKEEDKEYVHIFLTSMYTKLFVFLINVLLLSLT